MIGGINSSHMGWIDIVFLPSTLHLLHLEEVMFVPTVWEGIVQTLLKEFWRGVWDLEYLRDVFRMVTSVRMKWRDTITCIGAR